MDEESRKRYCGLLFLEMSNSDRSPNERMPLMIDSTSSLENSSINKKDNFVFTSFVGPMHVTKGTPSTTPLNLDTPTIAESSSPIIEPSDQSSPDAEPIKRPPNAFILYRKTMQPMVTAEYGIISNSKISKILSAMWKSEPDKVKLLWRREADRKKMEHSQKHPGYVYRPRKPKSIENRKRLNKLSRRKNQLSSIDASIHIGQFTINNGNNALMFESHNNDVNRDNISPPIAYYPNIPFDEPTHCVNPQSAGRNIVEPFDSGYILGPEQPMDMDNFFPANSREWYSFSIQDLAPCSPEEATFKSSQGQIQPFF